MTELHGVDPFEVDATGTERHSVGLPQRLTKRFSIGSETAYAHIARLSADAESWQQQLAVVAVEERILLLCRTEGHAAVVAGEPTQSASLA